MTIINHDAPVSECPDWCLHDAGDHGWTNQTKAGYDTRSHVIEFGAVEASTDNQRDAFVCLQQHETLTKTGLEYGDLRIGLAADQFPQFTSAEARRVAARLVAAADRLDEIESAR